MIEAGNAAALAKFEPTGENILDAALKAYAAIKICYKNDFPRLPPAPRDPPEGNPPGKTPPRITPGPQRTPPQNEPHNCRAQLVVGYGVNDGDVSAQTAEDPSTATVRVDWGDGTSTTQALAWGSSVTLYHNYFYSDSPWGRQAPGEGSDGDPDGDGSEIYVVQATVLETGAKSGYGFVDHIGPFRDDTTH
jgi:hypothetical protein